MLRLTPLRKVGTNEHRSGWPYVLSSLEPLLDDESGVVFDDFVERTFLYEKNWHKNFEHDRPWVGAIHHPPDMPSWYLPNLHLQRLDKNPRWNRSRKHLRLLVSFGDNLTRWVQRELPDVPVVTLKHPTGLPTLCWQPDLWLQNTHKKMLQVGWFLRNTFSIYTVPPLEQVKKVHLCQSYHWVEWAHWACEKVAPQLFPDRKIQGHTRRQPNVSDVEYDILLSRNIVFVELISAVANNTVVECIARNTPIVVNRHPGPKYYLGKDYPLFYDHIDEIPELITDDNVLTAHEYLRTMDKSWIRGGIFREDFYDACRTHVPELQHLPVAAGEVKCIL